MFPKDFECGYTDSVIIMSKKFYSIFTSGLYCKSLMIIIYDCNNSTIVWPVLFSYCKAVN